MTSTLSQFCDRSLWCVSASIIYLESSTVQLLVRIHTLELSCIYGSVQELKWEFMTILRDPLCLTYSYWNVLNPVYILKNSLKCKYVVFFIYRVCFADSMQEKIDRIYHTARQRRKRRLRWRELNTEMMTTCSKRTESVLKTSAWTGNHSECISLLLSHTLLDIFINNNLVTWKCSYNWISLIDYFSVLRWTLTVFSFTCLVIVVVL